MANNILDSIPEVYQKYVRLVPEEEISAALSANAVETENLLSALPREKWLYRYAADKWTICELVQHVIDTERIFSYRALSIARGEKQSLPGFDENAYAAASAANHRTKEDLLKDFGAVRAATKCLFESFTKEQLLQTGTSNQKVITPEAIGWIIAGHARHHLNILQERYL